MLQCGMLRQTGASCLATAGWSAYDFRTLRAQE
jgi:hypothetical protein